MASWVQKKCPDGTFDLVPRAELSAWMEQHYPDKFTGKPFVFKRVQRGSWILRDGKLIPKSAQILQFRQRGPQIIKDIEPFRNVAIDHNEIIGGRKQKRDMMRARGVVECGDVKASDFRKPYDPKQHQASVVIACARRSTNTGMGIRWRGIPCTFLPTTTFA